MVQTARTLRMFSAIALLAAAAASPAAGSGPELGPICPSILRPVCAAREGGQRTFSNQCMAERAGYRVLSEGGCEAAMPVNRPLFCPRHHHPVCGVRGGTKRTFGNSCEAAAEAFRVVHEGACGTS